jgi:8-oxo-dGTP pyrophosphatase MutT (NUDIX family)
MKTKNPVEDVLVGEDLYHVTWLKHLPSIQASGLQPGDSGNFRAYAFHASNKLFLCEADALPYWWNKFTEMVDIGTAPDNWHELDHIPIVLRVAYVEGLHLADDALGSRDSNYDAYYTEQTIPPEDLSVFSVASDDWENLDDEEVDGLKEDMEYAFLEVSEDGATWIEADWDALEPEPLEYAPDKGAHADKTQNPLSDVVYHRTSLFALSEILKDNMLLPTVAYGRSGEEKHSKKWYFLSTMRSPDADYSGIGVTLTLDGRKLSQTYKGMPIDYFGHSPYQKQDEMEDRLVTDKPYINNASKYITRISIQADKRDLTEPVFHRRLVNVLGMAKARNIPVDLYEKSAVSPTHRKRLDRRYKRLDASHAMKGARLSEVLTAPLVGPIREYTRPPGENTILLALLEYLDYVFEDAPRADWSELSHNDKRWQNNFEDAYYRDPKRQALEIEKELRDVFQSQRSQNVDRKNIHTLLTKIKSTGAKTLADFIEIVQGAAIEKRDRLRDSDKTQNPVDYVEPTRYWGSVGAGIVAVARSTGRVLMQLRSAYVDQPLTWGVVGGKLDANESNLELVAGREFKEETGYHGELSLAPAYKFVAPSGNFTYQNYIGLVDDEFQPELDWETKRFAWMELEDAIRVDPMHFGLAVLLDDEESFKLLYAATEAA